MSGAVVLTAPAEANTARSTGGERKQGGNVEIGASTETQNGQILGMKYIDSAQNSRINGTPILVKSRKR